MTTTGDARSTEVRTLGSELVADAAVGSLVLAVDFAADFDEDGGTLALGGATLTYLSVDHDAETIALATPLTVAAQTDDFVAQMEGDKPGVEVTTNVTVDEGDPLPVVVPTGLIGFFPEGESDDESTVQVRSSSAGYEVATRPETDSLYDGASVWNPRAKLAVGSTTVPDSGITWTNITSWSAVELDGLTVTTNANVVLDGTYMILARVQFPTSATGRRGARITFNGSAIETELQAAEPSGTTFVAVFDSVKATTDDTIGLQIQQSSGASMTVANGQMTIFRTSS